MRMMCGHRQKTSKLIFTDAENPVLWLAGGVILLFRAGATAERAMTDVKAEFARGHGYLIGGKVSYSLLESIIYKEIKAILTILYHYTLH